MFARCSITLISFICSINPCCVTLSIDLPIIQKNGVEEKLMDGGSSGGIRTQDVNPMFKFFYFSDCCLVSHVAQMNGF